MRGASNIYVTDRDACGGLPIYKALALKPKIDVLELGPGKVTDFACKYGLSALQPFDLNTGCDLALPKNASFIKNVIDKFEPILVLVAWPCTEWNLFNENMNYSTRPEELQQQRVEQQPLVDLGAWACERRRFLGENPLRSRLWSERPVDAGAYGAENSEGFPIIKSHQWIGNSEHILKNLGRRGGTWGEG